MSGILPSRLVVSNDSGPMHLACLVDAPIIGLFFADSPTLFAPLGSRVRSVAPPLYSIPLFSVYNGKDVAVGQVGELYARNPTLISGYHGNEDATRSSQRDGFFSVGDCGRIDAQGYYYLESRKSDMVISGGVNQQI